MLYRFSSFFVNAIVVVESRTLFTDRGYLLAALLAAFDLHQDSTLRALVRELDIDFLAVKVLIGVLVGHRWLTLSCSFLCYLSKHASFVKTCGIVRF